MHCGNAACGVLNTARSGSMGSTNTEGPNTASTGSSTETRVQQAEPAAQTPEMVGVLTVSGELNP